MRRVGLTGGLGSGKTTAAAIFAGLGAHVFSADEIARELMEPGTDVFHAIVDAFGPAVVQADGRLDRAELARIAFAESRVEELNAIIHPATIAMQARLADEIFYQDPNAIVIVESALIFETRHGAGWRDRFDKLILVSAPDALKVARFVARSGSDDASALEAEAKRRLARIIPDSEKAHHCDFVIANDGSLEHLRQQVEAVWSTLRSV